MDFSDVLAFEISPDEFTVGRNARRDATLWLARMMDTGVADGNESAARLVRSVD